MFEEYPIFIISEEYPVFFMSKEYLLLLMSEEYLLFIMSEDYPLFIMSEEYPLYNLFTTKLFNLNLTRSTTSDEWEIYRFDEMEGKDFEILLIGFTFYLCHVQNLVFNDCANDNDKNTNKSGTMIVPLINVIHMVK